MYRRLMVIGVVEGKRGKVIGIWFGVGLVWGGVWVGLR